MNARKNLVIVRTGDKSLHPEWLNGPGEQRNWDLIVSYWGDDPDKFRGGDWIRIDTKGFKFPALYDMLRSEEELIRKYDYILLADDDLASDCQSINRLFDICREYSLDLSQPALTPDSFLNHYSTLRCPFFRLRFTTFVEVMVPCLSQRALWKLLPTMNESESGWGLDDIWPTVLGPDYSIAIVDEVAVRHTRPCGTGQLYKGLAAMGRDATTERAELNRKYGTTWRYWTRSAVTRSGSLLPDGFRFLFLYGLGIFLSAPRMHLKLRDLRHLWLSAIYQQIKGRKASAPNRDARTLDVPTSAS